MQPPNQTFAFEMTTEADSKFYIRDTGQNALDSAAFHYSIYRSLTRFLGMDGNLAAGYDTPVNFVDAWNEVRSLARFSIDTISLRGKRAYSPFPEVVWHAIRFHYTPCRDSESAYPRSFIQAYSNVWRKLVIPIVF